MRWHRVAKPIGCSQEVRGQAPLVSRGETKSAQQVTWEERQMRKISLSGYGGVGGFKRLGWGPLQTSPCSGPLAARSNPCHLPPLPPPPLLEPTGPQRQHRRRCPRAESLAGAGAPGASQRALGCRHRPGPRWPTTMLTSTASSCTTARPTATHSRPAVTPDDCLGTVRRSSAVSGEVRLAVGGTVPPCRLRRPARVRREP